jgi:hypothetical protein
MTAQTKAKLKRYFIEGHRLTNDRWCNLVDTIFQNQEGATSVADGGTITHGLGTTPTGVIVTPSTSGEIASVTAVDATTFTVALKKISDGSAGTTQTVYWRAFV